MATPSWKGWASTRPSGSRWGLNSDGEEAGGPDPMTPALLVEEAGNEFQAENLDRLRTWSIVAGFGLAIISGFGGFALSGIILRPVRDITEVASENQRDQPLAAHQP